MTKRLLIFTFAASLMMAPVQILRAADASYEMAQDISDEVTITVNGQMVTISGAQGETLEVISLTGRKIMSVRIDSPAQRIELGVPKGVYILKVGKVVRKVSLR
jgi:maltodextrin utilization protein YvdJ